MEEKIPQSSAEKKQRKDFSSSKNSSDKTTSSHFCHDALNFAI